MTSRTVIVGSKWTLVRLDLLGSDSAEDLLSSEVSSKNGGGGTVTNTLLDLPLELVGSDTDLRLWWRCNIDLGRSPGDCERLLLLLTGLNDDGVRLTTGGVGEKLYTPK
jgi:hypothetical protein